MVIESKFKGKVHRPFAPLIRDSEVTEDFFLFLFAEKAKRNKDDPSMAFA
jgi:hypothetical protein